MDAKECDDTATSHYRVLTNRNPEIKVDRKRCLDHACHLSCPFDNEDAVQGKGGSRSVKIVPEQAL